ncbi:cation transporter, partial [Acidithiobacillus ferrooxidans F221]|nr:cation transporter [Acidithiobacillus ferrooxidans F221]
MAYDQHDDHDHATGHQQTHGHAHGHNHAHGPAGYGRAFAIGVALNLSFVLVEAVFGVMGHSLALLA